MATKKVTTKKWYLSRTMWINGLMVIASVLLLATKELDLSSQSTEIILFLWGIANILLRAVTKEEVTL